MKYLTLVLLLLVGSNGSAYSFPGNKDETIKMLGIPHSESALPEVKAREVEIETAIIKRSIRLNNCFEKQLERAPGSQTTFFYFLVSEAGKLTNISYDNITGLTDVLSNCVIAELARTRVSSTGKGEMFRFSAHFVARPIGI